MDPIDEIAWRLDSYGCRPLESASGWTAACPVHPDRTARLTVTADGVHCSDGCSPDRVLAALDLPVPDTWDDPAPAQPSHADTTRHPYTDVDGTLLFEIVRSPDKKFTAWHVSPGGTRVPRLPQGAKRVPYRLREVISAIRRGEWILLPEGELHCDRLGQLGYTASTNPFGAGSWQPQWGSMYFRGARAVVLPDNDAPGMKHAAAVAESLFPVAEIVKVLSLPELPEKGDVIDWLDAGGSAQQLRDLIDAAPPWIPEDGGSAPRSTQRTRHRRAFIKLDRFALEQVARNYKLSPHEQHLLMACVMLADFRSARLHITLVELAATTSVGRNNVRRLMTSLVEKQLIALERDFRSGSTGEIVVKCYANFIVDPVPEVASLAVP